MEHAVMRSEQTEALQLLLTVRVEHTDFDALGVSREDRKVDAVIAYLRAHGLGAAGSHVG